ncbi:hypothetical protein OpiT1DRAFT_05670 [Opitutaceae bacterium TAV1]|nr:hypothetical protein OpiT1DRAFT_05670 [Opitutaceae bacterium TAV1]
MLTSVELHHLSVQARNWLENQSLVPSSWGKLPDFPESADLPVWLVPDDPTLLLVQPDPELRARTYRRRYDPDEKSAWVFVPGTENRVWLVNAKRLPAPSN